MTTIPRNMLLQSELRRCIADGLRARGLEVQVTERVIGPEDASPWRPLGYTDVKILVIEGRATIDVTATMDLDVKEHSTKVSSFRYRPNGQFSSTMGPYRDRRTFRLGKAGWNMEGILEHLEYCVRRALRERQTELQKSANQDAAAEVVEATGLRPYGAITVEPSGSPENPVRVRIKGDMVMSAEAAVALVNALRALGVQ